MKLRKTAACFLASAITFAGLPLGASAVSAQEMKAPSAILMEAQTGKVLLKKIRMKNVPARQSRR